MDTAFVLACGKFYLQICAGLFVVIGLPVLAWAEWNWRLGGTDR